MIRLFSLIYLRHRRQHSADVFHGLGGALDHALGLHRARIICRIGNACCAKAAPAPAAVINVFVSLFILKTSVKVNNIFPAKKDNIPLTKAKDPKCLRYFSFFAGRVPLFRVLFCAL